jgi:hypothetical protein
MKTTALLTAAIAVSSGLFISCQKEYVEQIPDKPTDKINYISLTASQDSAKMFEPVIIRAVAEGKNLQYKWQKNKGSLVLENDSTARFWGCPTCLNWVTVSCTVSNEYGWETKEVKVFINREMYEDL